MINALAISDPLHEQATEKTETTIDLAVLAQVSKGDRIRIEGVADRTLELFQKTLRIVDENTPFEAFDPQPADPNRYVPEHGDLRKRFLFAEALGSYSALHDLLDNYSPAYKLSLDYDQKAQIASLNPEEVAALEDYRSQIHSALEHANDYLLANASTGYSADELHELNEILIEARTRFETITAILGMQLIRDVEDAVRQLYAFQDKIRTVQRSIDGIFLVDSEVMFMPTNDLVTIVNNLFRAIGNPFVAEHIDGMLLLAARNLLIQAVSFYSYYGKQQIYTVFKKKHATVNRSMITHHIRSEIRKLFRACMTENRLVLTRIINNAEREFEISVDAIRDEAERSAVEAVNLLIPQTVEVPPPPPKTWIQRLSTWMFR